MSLLNPDVVESAVRFSCGEDETEIYDREIGEVLGLLTCDDHQGVRCRRYTEPMFRPRR